MPKTKVRLVGEVHICTGSTYTVVSALEAMKCIGIAYGLYDHSALSWTGAGDATPSSSRRIPAVPTHRNGRLTVP